MRMHQHAYKIWLFSLVKLRGSLTGAAQDARLSPSALSQSVSQLEELLDLKLLDRGPRGVRLTAEGEVLLEVFGPALGALEAFDRSLLVAGLTPKRLRIGAYESIAVELLPRFVPALRAQWPGLEVELAIARSRELLDRCRQGELDVVFVADPTHGANLVVRPYAQDSYGLFAARGAIGSAPASLWKAVEALGFGSLCLDDKHHSRSYRRFLRAFEPALRPTLETESFEAILALVRGGALVGALPLRVARRAEGELVRLDGPSGDAADAGRTHADLGAHDLSLACLDSFSKPLFDKLFALARAEA